MKIDGNYIEGSWAEGIFYEIGWNPTITNNTLKNNAIIRGGTLSGASGTPGSFPEAAIYVSESGWDSRADSLCPNNCGSATVGQIAGNVLIDNWSGVTAWENADRYCGAPPVVQCGFNGNTNMAMYNGNANATTPKCTATTSSGGIESSWDCRWNVQNLNVTNNQFSFSRTNVDTWRTSLASAGDRANGFQPYTFFNVACTQSAYCGQNSTVSKASSTSYWPGDTVACAITFGGRVGGTDQAQGSGVPTVNFHGNTYNGDWHFDAVEANQSGTGATLTFSQWQTATGSVGHCVFNLNTEDHPAQDAGSTITP
jgi:parallel beta-helix repeat protein